MTGHDFSQEIKENVKNSEKESARVVKLEDVLLTCELDTQLNQSQVWPSVENSEDGSGGRRFSETVEHQASVHQRYRDDVMTDQQVEILPSLVGDKDPSRPKDVSPKPPLTEVHLTPNKETADELLPPRTLPLQPVLNPSKTEEAKPSVASKPLKQDQTLEEFATASDVAMASGLQELLERLGLTKFVKKKITKHDVNVIRPNAEEGNDAKSLPWKLLRGIIRLDYRVRDQAVHEFNESLAEIGSNEETLNPQDVLNATLQCCSPMLRQILGEKMFSCKLAFPVFTPMESKQHQLNLWSMRTIEVEGYQSDEVVQGLATEIPSHVLMVARLGDLHNSKSDFLNSFLFESNHKAFCNYNCAAGDAGRLLDGQIEGLWYLPGKTAKANILENVTVVMNLRGDGLSYEHILDRAADVSTTVLLMVDLDNTGACKDVIVKLTSKVNVVLLVSSQSRRVAKGSQDRMTSCVADLVTSGKLEIVKAFNANENKINADLKAAIKRLQSKTDRIRFGDALVKVAQGGLCILDESLHDCQKGAELAREVIAAIEQIGLDKGRNEMLPLQASPWHKYSKALKMSKRLTKSGKDQEASQADSSGEMLEERQKQFELLQKRFPLIAKRFIEFIDKHIDDGLVVDYFLKWLQLELDKCCKRVLPKLYADYRKAWQKHRDAKSNPEASTEEIKSSEIEMVEFGKKIDSNSIGLEHMFREAAQIYEAVDSARHQKLDSTLDRTIRRLPKAIAKLIARGHTLELMDGDASNIPIVWLKRILNELVKSLETKDKSQISRQKVLLLSILGVQSSGKSTLLNTMFGMQFSVSAGRCTKGIFTQLLPVSQSTDVGYDYLLVVDTEGLRAPELGLQQHDHDNELATLALGLGDVTIVNIKGENTEQMQDALQIAMHAFLRMSIADNKFRSKQKCIFIHNNVPALSAGDKILQAQQSLEKTLDMMIIEAANQESNCFIRSYREVIDLDLEKHVWYLKDLWKGSPPMAPVNPDYAESVAHVKHCLLTEIFASTEVQLHLENLETRVTDLWNAILTEDFIFSFRNTLEAKAYTDIQRKYLEIFWEAKDDVLEWTDTEAKGKITLCDTTTDLESCYEEQRSKLNDEIDAKLEVCSQKLDDAFEISDFQNLVIQWKQSKKNELAQEMIEVKEKALRSLKGIKENRRVELLDKDKDAKYENQILEKAKVLARKHKGSKISESELDKEFNEMWERWIREIAPVTSGQENTFHLSIVQLLRDNFSSHKPILLDVLRQNPFCCLCPEQCTFKQLAESEDAQALTEKVHVVKRKHGVFKKFQVAVGWSSADYLQQAAAEMNKILAKIDAELQRQCSQMTRFEDRYVGHLLRMFTLEVESFNEDNQNMFTITPLYKIQVAVKLCHVAYEALMIEHYKYEQQDGLTANLHRFRKTCHDQFINEVTNSANEIKAADFFCNAIQTPIQTRVEREMAKLVEQTLASDIGSKDHLIKLICLQLAEECQFKQFMQYAEDSASYAKVWIEKKLQRDWFDVCVDVGETLYVRRMRDKLEHKIESVKLSVKTASENFDEDNSMSSWVETFCKDISKHVPIAKNILRHVSETKVGDLDHFKSMILWKLDEDKSRLLNKLAAHSRSKWPEDLHPVNEVMEKVWGCKECCPFCLEPCRDSSTVHDGTHSCVQHRPKGVTGRRWGISSKFAILSSLMGQARKGNSLIVNTCNTDVAEGQVSFQCFNKCHPSGSSEAYHSYAKYKTYFPKWDIRPSNSTDDYSKFWCWFMVKFEEELPEYHHAAKADIPSSWRSITLSDAKESLI